MSWNTTLAVLPRTVLAELPVDDPAPVPLDAATSVAEQRLLAAQVGPHVVLVDAYGGVRVTPLAARLGRQVYVVVLGGTSDVYALQAEGPTTRLLVHTEGEVVEDRGEPLPVERLLAGAGDLEEAHLAMLEALAEVPPGGLEGAAFVALASDDLPL
ncbi:hypothetical protein ACFUMH_16295 [Cellulomonas sp. NPDC057328]|uniref:hypothetical protein n=1 Tax=Cellulomonas sp. NPDC057328 TaxID=3346101 RepID=UPI00362CE4F4